MSYPLNETYNLTVWEYLENARGPQQLPFEVAIPLTVVNVLIFVTGLVGNIIVCVVIIKHPAMHTATNYYLFNLAISDLTLLIFGLPNDVAVYWHQYPWALGEGFCKLRALLSEMATYVSVLTIVAFSTERYIAICHPLYIHAMSGLQRAVRIIAALWLISLFSAAPFSSYTSVHYLEFPPKSQLQSEESAFCGMLAPPEDIPLAELSTIIFFVFPMLIIAIQYAKMGLKISKQPRNSFGKGVKGSVHRGSRKSQSNKAVIRMLAAVVIGFFICWAPFHAQRLLFIYGQKSPHFRIINAWVFYITGILYYFSSTLNPILYNLMSNRYRMAFKEILCGIESSKKRLVRTSTFRETRFVSQSENNKIVNKKNPDDAVNLKDEERLQLVDEEVLAASTPKMKNSVVYTTPKNCKAYCVTKLGNSESNN